MGACGHVEVETLIAKDTVEFQVVELEDKMTRQEKGRCDFDFIGDSGRSLLSSIAEFQISRQKYLLKNVKLIKDNVEYPNNEQRMKRKLVEDSSLDTEAAFKSHNKI